MGRRQAVPAPAALHDATTANDHGVGTQVICNLRFPAQRAILA